MQVAGVGTTKTGYIIRFRDAQSTEAAWTNTEWLVYRTPTEDFNLEGNKNQGIEKIAENDLAAKGYQVEDIAWLKRNNKPLGTSASLGIWLDSPEAAEWVINNGLLVGQRYIGSIEAYQIKRKRCHCCQRQGHLAWSCKERARCSHCAGEHKHCHFLPGVRARCLDCNGDHPVGDQRCQAPLNFRK